MIDLKKHNRISAATVARLVRIREHDASIDMMKRRGEGADTYRIRKFCDRCQWDSMHICSRLPLRSALGRPTCTFFHKKEVK